MSEGEPQPGNPESEFPVLQFRLRTLLLAILVLASSLATFGVAGILAFLLVAVLAMLLYAFASFRPLLVLALLAVGMFALTVVWDFVTSKIICTRESARRAVCSNNLQGVALALLAYHEKQGYFPPAYIADAAGKPMHSWRVLILPYMGEQALYNAYNFNEPWDGPGNSKLLAKRPRWFACPKDPQSEALGAAQTNYLAVVGPNAVWPGDKPWKLAALDKGNISESEANTVLLVEVADSGVAWTEPRDFRLDSLESSAPGEPKLTVSSHHGPRQNFFFNDDRHDANVGMADRRAFRLPNRLLNAESLKKLLQRGGFDREAIVETKEPYEDLRYIQWRNIAALAVWLLTVGLLFVHAVRAGKARPSLLI